MQHILYSDLVYKCPYYWSYDYTSVRTGIANDVKGTTYVDPVINDILNNYMLRPVKPGEYPLKIKYRLPGKNIITSSHTINIISTVKTHASDF